MQLRSVRRMAALFLLTALVAVLPTEAQQAQPGQQTPQAQVRAVLFFSPTCPHCHDVMDYHLPPLQERFGDQLQIVVINAATPDGGRLYQDVVEAYRLPRDRLGVPALVVGSRVLVGSQEIPQLLPGLVTTGLAAGGTDWPQIASIRAALERAGMLQPQPPAPAPAPTPAPGGPARAADAAPVAAPATQPAPPPSAAAGVAPGAGGAVAGETGVVGPGEAGVGARTDEAAAAATGAGADAGGDAGLAGVGAAPFIDLTGSAAPASARQRFMRDPVGNGVAVIVLVGLLLVLAWSLLTVRRGTALQGQVPGWLVPALVVVGIAVASYLAFVEVTGSTAVCGPVGDCNTVQQSPHATLFGVLPVGVLGLIGYLGIGAMWLLWRLGPQRYRGRSSVLLYAAAVIGTAFSAYLTFLEPFVIGASCAWCLTSAAVIAVILLAATPPAALLRARGQPGVEALRPLSRR
jgi:uncharacterized membrane protein